MRKSKQHQKSIAEQLTLFSKNGMGTAWGAGSGTTGRPISRDELLSILERQRTLTNDLLEEIAGYTNLLKSAKHVVSKSGSGGVDGMEVDKLLPWLERNMIHLHRELLEETYEPSAVRKVEIPKANGGTRTLGLPTVIDRMIQQSIHTALNRYYDPLFSENSYGFRPGRDAQQAIVQASAYVSAGKEWVVDLDLENFFDKINHDRLMQRLSKGIGDKRVLRLIHSYLRSGILVDGLVTQRVSGTPQGGPLSPLLSNIVLDELDKELERRGHSSCRYADDCNVYVSSQRAGERVMGTVIDFIERKLKLKVNREKSGVRHCSETTFLGYTLAKEGKIRVSAKSINRLKFTIRKITKRNRGIRFDRMINELNVVIRGWTNYYRLANAWISDFREVDGWLRRKLRCYRLKQCGRRYTLYKFLRSRGISQRKSWNAIIYTQGWWALSHHVTISKSMPNIWFAQQGLLSLHAIFKGH